MANNFADDSNCKALWSFEDGALDADSIGNNTLTNVGVSADTSDYKEGGSSGELIIGHGDYMTITDANLDDGMPFKSGDPTKKISICTWYKANNYPATSIGHSIYSKWDGGGHYNFLACVFNNGSALVLRLGVGFNNGASWEWKDHTYNVPLATWFHLTFTYDNDDKSWALRIRDTDGNVVGSDATGTATLDANKISCTSVTAMVGATNPAFPVWPHYGWLDELAIFSDIITSDESTSICLGTYAPTPALGGMVSYNHRPSYKQDFARGAGESQNPAIWKQLTGAWCPSLGITGVKELRDISDGKHTAGFYGTYAITDWVSGGKMGHALNYNGDHLLYTPYTNAEIQQDTTYLAWIYMDDVEGTPQRGILGHTENVGAGSHSNHLGILSGGTVQGSLYDGASVKTAISSTVLKNGRWYLVGFGWKSDKVVVYVNGRIEAETATVGWGYAAYSTPEFMIGYSQRHTPAYFTGKIGNVFRWNKLLTDGEAKTIFRDSHAMLRLKDIPFGLEVVVGADGIIILRRRIEGW